MTTYIIRRLLWLIPTLFFVALITFVLMHATPGGPWDRDLSARQVDARTQELLNKEFGLDKPLFINTEGGNPLDSQFFNYIAGALQGDLGPSYRQRGMNVEDILFKAPEGKPFWDSKFGYSMRLGLLSLIMAVTFGIPLGVIGALRRNTIVDYFSLLISTIGISVPNFVLAILLIILVAGKLRFDQDCSARLEQPRCLDNSCADSGLRNLCFHHSPDPFADVRGDAARLCTHCALQRSFRTGCGG